MKGAERELLVMPTMPSEPPAVSKIPLILPNVCPSPCHPQAPLGHPLPCPSSHCIPRNNSEDLQNAILPELLRLREPILGNKVFIMKLATSIHLFLTCLNLKVTNAWKLPCNCSWVSQFHWLLIFMQRKTIISRIRKTSLAKSKRFLS